MAQLRLISGQLREIEKTREERLKRAPRQGTHPMVLLLAKILGIGIETADMLVHEILSRELRDERAVGRYAGLTGSPYDSGAKRREKGMSRAGNARVRRGMVQLAWRWIRFQKDSQLTQSYNSRKENARGYIRKTMIVALAPRNYCRVTLRDSVTRPVAWGWARTLSVGLRDTSPPCRPRR